MNWNEVKNFPAYICTTKNSARIESSLKELQKVGIQNINIIYGTDASTKQGEEEIIKKCNLSQINLKNCVRYGEAALSYAFYEGLTHFLSTDFEHMIWFEDDIILHPDYINVIEDLKKFNQWKNYDLLYLGSALVNEKWEVVKKLNQNIFWTDVSGKVIWGAHAFILNRKIATNIKEYMKFNFRVVDMLLTKFIQTNSNLFSAASLLYPLAFIDQVTLNWNDVYKEDKPPMPEMKELYKKYKRSFGELNTCWGLFFQRNVPSILQKQQQYKNL